MQQHAIRGKKLAITLAGLMLSLFLASIDSTIVNTALPRIIADLNGFELYAWVTTAYFLTSTASIPIVSKLSDIYGRKPILLTTVILFVASSGLSGAAQSMEQLVAFRALQGVFGGGVMSLAFSSMADLFSPAERGKWMGLFFAMFGFASVAGPLLGGIITETTSWRWVFYVNLPVGIAAAIVLATGFPTRIGHVIGGGWRKIDFLGAILVVVATTALLLGLVNGGQRNSWGSWQVIGLLAVFVIAFMALLVWERRAPEPLIPLSMFASRTVAVGTAIGFFCGMMMISTLLYAPLYAQTVLGDSPTAAGATIMPLMVTMMTGNTIFGRLMSKFGRYKPLMFIGVILLPLGTLLLTLLGSGDDRPLLIAGLILVGLGLAAIMPASNVAVQNVLPAHQIGAGTGMNTFIRTIGQSVGSAVIGTIVIGTFLSTLPGQLPPAAASLAPEVLERVTNPARIAGRTAGPTDSTDIDPAVLTEILTAVRSTIALGIRNAYIGAFILTLIIGVLVAFGLPDERLRTTRPGVAPPARAPEPVTAG